MSAAEHPGEVIFEDLERGTLKRVAAEALPESLAFGEVDGERVPVVRVLLTVEGENRLIRHFDEQGRELVRTVAVLVPKADAS